MYNTIMTIKKGTTVYPSVKGEYNFHYPQIEMPHILTLEIQVKKLHWAVREGKTPVEVVSPENYLPYKVLWVELPV